MTEMDQIALVWLTACLAAVIYTIVMVAAFEKARRKMERETDEYIARLWRPK